MYAAQLAAAPSFRPDLGEAWDDREGLLDGASRSRSSSRASRRCVAAGETRASSAMDAPTTSRSRVDDALVTTAVDGRGVRAAQDGRAARPRDARSASRTAFFALSEQHRARRRWASSSSGSSRASRPAAYDGEGRETDLFAGVAVAPPGRPARARVTQSDRLLALGESGAPSGDPARVTAGDVCAPGGEDRRRRPPTPGGAPARGPHRGRTAGRQQPDRRLACRPCWTPGAGRRRRLARAARAVKRLGTMAIVLGIPAAFLWWRILIGDPVDSLPHSGHRPPGPRAAAVLRRAAGPAAGRHHGRRRAVAARHSTGPSRSTSRLDDVIGHRPGQGRRRPLAQPVPRRTRRSPTRWAAPRAAACSSRARPAPARPTWPRRWPARPACRSCSCRRPSFQSMYYGATARKIRSYFKALRKAARARGRRDRLHRGDRRDRHVPRRAVGHRDARGRSLDRAVLRRPGGPAGRVRRWRPPDRW